MRFFRQGGGRTLGALLAGAISVLAEEGTQVFEERPSPAGTAVQTAPTDPARPAEERFPAPVRSPTEASATPPRAAGWEARFPTASDRMLIGGRWVSPQFLLGSTTDLPSAGLVVEASPPVARRPAAERAHLPQTARGYASEIAPPLVARYQDAPLVRFMAHPETVEGFLQDLGLDDLNRYQFRRNRPDTIPVEPASASAR